MPTVSLFAIAILGLPQTPVPDEMVRIAEMWEQRRQRTPPARYSLRRESFPSNLPPGSPKPGEDGAYTASMSLLLDPATSRLRMDRDELTLNPNRRVRLSRHRMTMRYDGREQFSSLQIDYNAATAPAEPNFRHLQITPWGQGISWHEDMNPVLWGHGLIRLSSDPASNVFPLAWQYDPTRFAADGREAVNGRDCIVLRVAGTPETLWVDAEHGGVARRRLEMRSGLTADTVVTHRMTPHGWLPSMWEDSEARPGEPAVLTRRVRIEDVSFNPVVTDDDFRVAFRPGMHVNRAGRSFQIGEDGSVPADAYDPVSPPAGEPLMRRVLGLIGYPGLVGVLVAGVLTVVFVRQRRVRNAAS